MPDLVYDGATFEHITREEYARRTAHREELAFRRRRKQGELACPMYIPDGQGGIHGIKSMADGHLYDSKSQMRKHYKETGHIEVGNDVQTKRPTFKADWQGNRDAAEKALCQLEIPE